MPATPSGTPRRGGLSALTLLLAAAPVAAAAATPVAPPPRGDPPAAAHEIRIDPRDFKVVPRDSGPVNYYTVVDDPEGAFIRGAYAPPNQTAVLGWALPGDLHRPVARVRWRWRILAFPQGGNECQSGKTDSAAVIYLTWKRGLRFYAVKYVWSTVGPTGAICARRRNIFAAQDTIIVESGGPLGKWRTVDVDPDAEFRKYFESGNPKADVAAFQGIGILSDGDQTQSPAAADFGGFVLTLR